MTKLEEGIADYVGRKFGVAVCNGSVAIELVVEALKLQPGDEVIMPAFTIISCIAPLICKGIIPVLVDSCADTWNMDVSLIEEKITEKTKAIMVVHIYGMPVEKTDFAENIYWVFGLVMKPDSKLNAQEVMKLLAERNVGCRSFFYPMHLHPVLRNMGFFEGESYPISEWLAEKGFYIPSGLGVTDEQMRYVAQQVMDVAEGL